ncbi:MAG: C4-dicarboxylate ABC transporter substrate-binding protein [Oceanospirillaceae bacterium]|nr:C4-dicarboxylate ABC transporter substrate-binding protein [Oceanospirillaceae bacterium]
MKTIRTASKWACALAGTLLCTSAMAETTLRVTTWLPPTNPQNVVVWPTWAKWVEEATEGRVKVEIEQGSGHPKTLFNLVEDGVTDVSFSVNGYLPGRFQLPGVAEIPGETGDAELGSVALWKVYKEYFEPADEFVGLKVLGMFVHGPGQLHTQFPVNSLDDLKDRKIRVGGGVVNELAERLHVTPVAAPATKVYEMMQQGIVEGVFLPLQEQKFLRLSEVTSHVTMFPKGMYTTAFTIFMNPDVFDDLSKEDQDAIMSVSGAKLSQLAGQAWGAADLAGYKEAQESGKTIVRLTADDPLVGQFNDAIEGMDEAWIESVADRGIDARAALNKYRELVSGQ